MNIISKIKNKLLYGVKVEESPEPSIQQSRFRVEYLPSEFGDYVRQYSIGSPCIGTYVNNVIGYQSLHSAIEACEQACLSLSGYIKSENIFFILSEKREFFSDFTTLEFPVKNYPHAIYCKLTDKDYNEDDCDKEIKRDPFAIIFCKLCKCEEIKDFPICKKQKSTKGTEGYQIAWSELRQINQFVNQNIKHNTSGKVSFNRFF